MGLAAKEKNIMPLETPLNAQYATQDEIPEAFRDLYEERGGQFHITKINGIKTDADVTRVTRSLTSEKEAHNTLKTSWKNFFGERKPEEVQAILDRVPELEQAAAGKLDDEKINGIVETRVRSKLAPVERDNQTLKAGIAERDQKIAQFEQRETIRTIHDAVRADATKLKVVDSAVDDVLMLAERVFEVNENGETVTKDGMNGVTPGLSPQVWLTEMQSKRAHWWPASKGGGAGGSQGLPTGFANNPFSHAHWNMTEQGRLHNVDPAKARQMAEVAGTTVGGPRPAK